MKLSELDAGFVSTNGHRTGLHFLCPKCKGQQLVIPFANTPSGVTDPTLNAHWILWQLSGDSIENVTLSPSVDAKHVIVLEEGGSFVAGPECHWHGWIRGGEVVDA